MAEAPTSDAKPKRGPGRPPKKLPAPYLCKDGIIESPSDASNRLEFVYGSPLLFKSLFTYFRNLKAVDVHLRCTPRGVTFFTWDATRMCRVVAELPGDSLNHYYCDDTFWLGLNRDEVDKIFASIDKSFFKITILHRHDDPDNLVVIFKDADLEKECHYRITVTTLERDESLFEAELLTTPEALKTFPVEFQLPSKQFKKSVTDAGNHSPTFTIEKLGEAPLQFTYTKVGMSYNEIYRAPEKIYLRSEVAGKVFRCTAAIANIKSLAAATVTDTVRIFCRENNDILLRSEIDALVMSTLTKHET
jgi:hypothetical protein